MSLPDGQLQILIAIEHELQADPELESAFSAFTSVTRDGSMPAAERLGPPDSPFPWGPSWRGEPPAFADRLLIAIAAVTVVAGIVVPVIILSRC
jgi:hypothetical protein